MKSLGRPRRPWDRTPVGDREYFELLGPGLVSVLPARRPNDSGRGGWQPPTGGAWLHVGTDSKVLAFSGKAEVGQGTRIALTTVVARDLRVPVSDVEVVMGDTDLCPWDMGTFGSRSMPDAAPALGAAAVGAREALLEIGAGRFGIPRNGLEARDGAVRVLGDPRHLSYGELVSDGDRVIVASPIPSWAPVAAAPAGAPALPNIAEEIVTGRRLFGSDLVRPGLLCGAILHPPTYGARLVSVDLEPTQRMPGVTAVRDGDFVGVVAPTLKAARNALAAVRAQWEGPPQPREPEIEAYLRAHPLEGDFWDQEERATGDVDRAMRESTVALERTYRTAYIAHVPLETRSALAQWEGPRLTVWVGTQTPFRARDAIAEALGLRVEDVRVIVPPTGSGFGGKHGGDLAIPAARLARAAGQPVRVSFSREEEFRYAYFRPMSVIDVRLAADPRGRLRAWSFHNVNGGSAALIPPYRVANEKIDNELSRSPLPQGSYRALAATANNFARETAIDEFARVLEADPVEVRRTNLGDDRLRTVLDRAVETADWLGWQRRPGYGHGVAVGLEKDSRVATVAEIRVTAARHLRVDRLVTAFEAGAIVQPDNLRSQVEGAMVMGIGGALFEAIRFDQGFVHNARLAQYRVPRFSDLPRLEVELIDRPDLPPSGAGETPMIAVAPAIGNAIFDATGQRLRSLPLAPDGVIPVERPLGREPRGPSEGGPAVASDR